MSETKKSQMTRRRFMKTLGAAAGTVALAPRVSAPAVLRGVTIRHWCFLDYPDDPIWAELVKRFNDTHNDIKVEVDILPFADLRTKVNTAVATGAAPDTVRAINYWFGEAELSGWYEPLDPWVDKWPGKSDIVDGVIEFGRPRPGRPLIYLVDLMAPQTQFYRRDWVREVGLEPPPANGWTHEQWMNAVLKLNKPPDRAGWGLRGDYNGWWFWTPYLKQNGVEIVKDNGEVDLDGQEAIDTTEWYVDIHRKHKAAQPSCVTDGWAAIVNQFTAEKIAIVQHSLVVAPALVQKLGDKVAPMTLPRGKRNWVQGQTTGFAMFKTSKNKEAAWEWMTWFASAPQQKTWTQGQKQWSMPTNKSLRDDPFYKTPYFQVNFEQSKWWGKFPTWHPHWAQWVDKEFAPRWQQCLQGQLGVKEMLTGFAEAFRKDSPKS